MIVTINHCHRPIVGIFQIEQFHRFFSHLTRSGFGLVVLQVMLVMKTCYYQILRVSLKASQEEIRRAYRLQALRCHPDQNPHDPNAGQRFRETLEAYETLIDPVRRLKYDQLKGYSEKRSRGAQRVHGSSRGPGVSVQQALKEAFGIECADSRVSVVSDLRFDLQVPRSSVINGAFEWIAYAKMVFCDECVSKGRKRLNAACARCSGRGALEESCSLRVWIPPGSMQGSRLRISGAGDRPSPDARAGDLVILLYVTEN
jgi:molecular chaperone DnaJ